MGKHRCNHWLDVCDKVCKEERACRLHDTVDERHYTRHRSCQKECQGFNWHKETGHCTLFSDNLKLLHGGRGMYYGRPGFPKPEWGSLELYLKGYGITVQNLLTPMSLVVSVAAIVSLAFFARRWAMGTNYAQITRDLEVS